MTPLIRRGKWIYVTLATVIVLDQLVPIVAAMAGNQATFGWVKYVIQPLTFAIPVAVLWFGDAWLRWIVSATCFLAGGLYLFVSIRQLIAFGEPPRQSAGMFIQRVDYPLGLIMAFGVFYLAAGMLFAFSPSLRAFLQHQRDQASRRNVYGQVDALNEESGGGPPIVSDCELGTLRLRSGTLLIGDPQYLPGLALPNIVAGEVAISACIWRYPNGSETIASLTLRLGDEGAAGSLRTIGQVGIDSAKLVVLDKADFEEHWASVGKDRIGEISTVSGDELLRTLTKRFRLKTRSRDRLNAEIIGPVSEELDNDIEAFLKADPQYADYPFLHFRVRTNNSFDRVNSLNAAHAFLPVGNQPEPVMFVCGIGRGDGLYDVRCAFDGDVPRCVTIEFIEDAIN